jgi:hypothetical protein
MTARRRRNLVLGLGLLAAFTLALLDRLDDATAPVAAVTPKPKKPRRVLPTRFFNPDAPPPALADADAVAPPDPDEVGDTGALAAPLDPATLVVSVDDPFDSPTTFVQGCGLWNHPLGRGESVALTIEPGEWCTVDAWRYDGAFRALALPEAIFGEPGARIALEFVLPDFQMGGMGFAFQNRDEAVVVRSVYAGTPAWHAGLRQGDVILAVDGESTEGMSDNEFVAFGTGPAGTLVTLELARADGEVETVEIERALLAGT